MNVITEANRIKDRLRACKTPDEVHRVADEERSAYQQLENTPEGRPLAIQIKHLKVYTLKCLQH